MLIVEGSPDGTYAVCVDRVEAVEFLEKEYADGAAVLLRMSSGICHMVAQFPDTGDEYEYPVGFKSHCISVVVAALNAAVLSRKCSETLAFNASEFPQGMTEGYEWKEGEIKPLALQHFAETTEPGVI